MSDSGVAKAVPRYGLYINAHGPLNGCRTYAGEPVDLSFDSNSTTLSSLSCLGCETSDLEGLNMWRSIFIDPALLWKRVEIRQPHSRMWAKGIYPLESFPFEAIVNVIRVY